MKGGVEEIKMAIEEIQAYYGMITKDNGECIITPPKNLTNKTRDRTNVYKMYNMENKCLEQCEESSIEKCLVPVMTR